MADNLKVIVRAALDATTSETTINSQLSGLSSKLKPVAIRAKISNIKEIQKELSNLTVSFTAKRSSGSLSDPIKQIQKEARMAKAEMDALASRIADNERKILRARNNLTTYKNRLAQIDDQNIRQRDQNFQKTLRRENLNSYTNRERKQLQSLYESDSQLARARGNALIRKQYSEIQAIENMAKQASKNTRALIADTSEYEKSLNKIKHRLKEIEKMQTGKPKGKAIQDVRANLSRINSDINKDLQNQQVAYIKRQQEIMRNRLDVWAQANPRAIKDSRIIPQYEKVQQLLSAPNITAAALQNANKEMQMLHSQTHKFGVTGNTMFASLAEKAKKFATWFSISQVIMYSIRSLKMMYHEVLQIDRAMTNLKKVTDETQGSYVNFMNNAVALSKDLHVRISDVIQSTADWARLGYSMAEAQENAKASIVLKNVGDMDIESSTQAIISTLKSYGSQVGSTIDIIDKYNEVGNNFAISSKGVAEAMQRSASALKLGGNSLDEAIAIITAGNAVIQDPTAVGTFAKTMSMRLRGAANIPKSLRDELEEMGEDLDDIDETVTQVQAKMLKFTQGRVNIMLDENTFKSTYQILKEINAIWDQLADKDRASIVELVGGNIYYSFNNNIALSVQKCA